MSINKETYLQLSQTLKEKGVTLVAVSKTKPAEDILALYELGHRDFGENYVQELAAKQEALPKDIRWHFIGHLQRNKVKYIAPFVHLIHGVDNRRLLEEISRQAQRAGRIIDCLMQVHIAQEETKFGWSPEELEKDWPALTKAVLDRTLSGIQIKGLMGMASFSSDETLVRSEFRALHQVFERLSASGPAFSILSMGMSGDYAWAIEAGSNLVRVGSLIFGARG